MKELLKKLHEIQKEVKYFQKDVQGYNYKFVSGTEILSKIRPLMDEKGLLLIQGITNQKIESVPVLKNGTMVNNYLTICDFIFSWIDIETGQRLDIPFCGQGHDNSDKGIGMACTYSERYFFKCFFHFPTDEDDPDRYEQKTKDYKAEILKEAEKCNQLPPPVKDYFEKLKSSTQNYTVEVYNRDRQNLKQFGGQNA